MVHDIKVAGFVGWQTIDHPDGYKAGYYSVGILPEFRGKGLAKTACRTLIAENGAGVKQVRALIVDGNDASEKLAKSLGVAVDRHDPREKSAGAASELVRRLLSHGASRAALGAGAGLGVGAAENNTTLSNLGEGNKHLNLLLNGLTGAGAGLLHGTPEFRKSLALMLPGLAVKEMGLQGLNTAQNYIGAQQKLTDTNLATAENQLSAATTAGDTQKAIADRLSHLSTTDKIMAGALGLGGLGLGIYGYNSFKGKSRPVSTKVQSDAALRHKSKIRLDIPADAIGSDVYDKLFGAAAKPAMGLCDISRYACPQ